MMVYKGDATDPADMTEEEGRAVMAAWGTWMENVGSALVDIGTPLAPVTSVVDDGTTATPTSLNGYSIVEAEDVDAARRLTDGHPFLSEGKGDYAIDLYEMLAVPR
jgi:hypothetical protein